MSNKQSMIRFPKCTLFNDYYNEGKMSTPLSSCFSVLLNKFQWVSHSPSRFHVLVPKTQVPGAKVGDVRT